MGDSSTGRTTGAGKGRRRRAGKVLVESPRWWWRAGERGEGVLCVLGGYSKLVCTVRGSRESREKKEFSTVSVAVSQAVTREASVSRVSRGYVVCTRVCTIAQTCSMH